MADGVEQELRALREEIARFNAHRFVQVQNSLGRLLLQALLRGMAVGLGTVIGASILVSVVVYVLSQIDFVPVIGDWAKEIAEEIKVPTGEAASDGTTSAPAND
ncbi:DUF5665 domain-containing protein [Ruegeria sp. 2012CJ41-6]|uniref:DUF5665 domain-containing protein n=1 Tax=Ruegeria spongiae TaxID=2942209 RepID=A0ABT0PZC4_9RHOB|nr:DUF5665 domain-containing protein [Ruegeria spongiae]MCL6282968.1 DUF5665 domain-containing protein [Ruegeria spongiae]